MSSKWSVPSGFHTKTLHEFLFSHTRVTFPANLIVLDLIILIIFGEEYTRWSSSLWSFLQLSVTSSFDLDIPLSTLFPNILSYSSSLHARDEVLCPCERTEKSIASCILNQRFHIADPEHNGSMHLQRHPGFFGGGGQSNFKVDGSQKMCLQTSV
jgi:hypothetical protein